jgi:2-amino-4-hydroxy-6-hydroxymethyldihydropteridine diphosphokinase
MSCAWRTATDAATDARLAAVAIGLGTNLGDRLENLAGALLALRERIGPLTGLSRVYASEPVGFRDQPEFWNAVALFETGLTPLQVFEHSQTIERALGRVATFRGGPRIIDLDVLLYDDVVLSSDPLVVPHPRLHERAFVLRPLAELAPDRIHPRLARRVDALREAVADQHAHPLEDASRRLCVRLGIEAER